MESIIKNTSWDEASRQHKCKANSRHCIKQGEKRLKYKKGEESAIIVITVQIKF